ncbi:hypothetical protein [Fructobacillus ficulneus]|uniref:Uncharacterized protein n=1 Tax=Fructobacillus ficulneus TaxID=157463 RepID=A0A0K8MFY5_9LACO|nr:hypothetical protein [Fructobacillus ficulneus]GAO99402.1 hypothetical protein FFIC_100030 [Fructobacillus ficulneus]
MVRLDWKLYFSVMVVMGLLFQMLLYSQTGDTPIYFVDNSTRILVVKLTYFALLLAPMVMTMGSMKIWQTGAYLNRLIRMRHLEKLLVEMYLRSLVIVLTPVLILCLGNQILVGRLLWSQTFALGLSYALAVGVYVAIELRFNTSVAILSSSFLLLSTGLGSQQLKLFGPFVFQKVTAIWQIPAVFGALILLFLLISVQVKRQDFMERGNYDSN